jgi:DNA adenine methylase
MCLLRYPGGKQRATTKILPLIPVDTTTLYSPFFGGGAVEFAWLAANPNGKVVARDAFQPLVNFWKQVFAGQGPAMASYLRRRFFPMDKDMFALAQNQLRAGYGTPFQQACWFYAVNRSSFSGTTLSGGMGSADRYTESALERLADFVPPPGLSFGSADAFDSLRRRPLRFAAPATIYLDPPYLLTNGKNKLYGDKGSAHGDDFNHLKLSNILRKLDMHGVRWVLSYNDCEQVRKLYAGLRSIPKEWKYGMSAEKDGAEVIILSRGAEE